LEIPFRNILKERFSRGKFDITVAVPEVAAADLTINTGFVVKIYDAFRKLQEEVPVKGEIDINTLVNLHELFIETRQRFDADAVTGIFKNAVDDLYRMRTSEGEALAGEMHRMLDIIGNMNGKVKGLCAGVIAGIKDKFNERMMTILEGREIDSNRILQEAAIMAARLDVSEELARIESHLRQFREILGGGGIIGRKLDFILQELNREVNTIASKSTDYDVSSLSVEMKTEIEKIREQVQNIQ
jgi:uncharacterized protein (TIGR00255 family)